MKKAFVTGITGQDGSYLAELLLDKGYEVHGVIRRSSTFTTDRIDHLYVDPRQRPTRLFLHYGDLSDGTTLTSLLNEIRPDEVYNLGAQSHVKVSFETPIYTANVDALGTLRLLEAIRALDHEGRVHAGADVDAEELKAGRGLHHVIRRGGDEAPAAGVHRGAGVDVAASLALSHHRVRQESRIQLDIAIVGRASERGLDRLHDARAARADDAASEGH